MTSRWDPWERGFRRWSLEGSLGDDYWKEKSIPVQRLVFTQKGISPIFTSGSCGIFDMVRKLLDDGDFSSVVLDVVVQGGVYYSCNNRSLAALKIYTHISRAVIASIYRQDECDEIETNQEIRVGDSCFVPFMSVPCRIRRFSDYNCSHDVECRETPTAVNVLHPVHCKDIKIRGIELTVQEVCRRLAKLFTGDDPEDRYLMSLGVCSEAIAGIQKKAVVIIRRRHLVAQHEEALRMRRELEKTKKRQRERALEVQGENEEKRRVFEEHERQAEAQRLKRGRLRFLTH